MSNVTFKCQVLQKHAKCYILKCKMLHFFEIHAQCYSMLSKYYFGGSIMLHDTKFRHSMFVLLQLEKEGVAKAKGEGEKEKECTTGCKSRRRRDEKAPWALNYESGEGGGDAKERRRGGEKRAMYVCVCDVCAAHGDRAAVGVDVDAQGSGLREDESHFPLNARVECCAFVSERIWFALARRKGGSRRLSR